jgi:DNA recombination protein RmuC
MEKIERSLGTADNAFREAKQKLHSGKGNIVKKLEDIKKLGAKTTKSIPDQYSNNNALEEVDD